MSAHQRASVNARVLMNDLYGRGRVEIAAPASPMLDRTIQATIAPYGAYWAVWALIEGSLKPVATFSSMEAAIAAIS